jgi:hypothetical protein
MRFYIHQAHASRVDFVGLARLIVKSRSQSRKRVPNESTACVIIHAQHVHEIAAREFATY